MKYLMLLIPILMVSCHSSRHCTANSRYLQKVDTTRSYRLKGAYCIAGSQDTIVPGNNSLVRFQVFDRINGRIVPEGVIARYGKDTIRSIFHGSPAEISNKPGEYRIMILTSRYIEYSTPVLLLKPNQITTINFFLGNRVDY